MLLSLLGGGGGGGGMLCRVPWCITLLGVLSVLYHWVTFHRVLFVVCVCVFLRKICFECVGLATLVFVFGVGGVHAHLV